MKKFFVLFFSIIFLTSLCTLLPTKASGEDAVPLPSLLSSQGSSAVQLKNVYVDLYPSEVTSILKMDYAFLNILDKKASLTVALGNSPLFEGLPVLTFSPSGKEIPRTYDKQTKLFSWKIAFQPNEEIVFKLTYKVRNAITVDGISTMGISWSEQDTAWFGPSGRFSFVLHFDEITPGLISGIQPLNYKLDKRSLLWSWDSLPDSGNITIQTTLVAEKMKWESTFTDEEQEQLHLFLSVNNYLASAFLYGNKIKSAPGKEQINLSVGQAYYFEKAGKNSEALKIWQQLYEDNKSVSPMLFWYMGQSYASQIDRLSGLYLRVKTLMVHPLLQQWFALQLPQNMVRQSVPEVTYTSANIEKMKYGVNISATLYDPDGDIESIVLRYNYGEGLDIEIPFIADPFQYSQNINYLVPMDKSMQMLNYCFVLTDKDRHTIISDKKEIFYLTSDIQSDTYPLHGAKLVLGDYTVAEHDKVYKWFKSYLKMALDAKFIPLEGKAPFFIFLGQKNEFADLYQGPLFLMYTPAPFSPDATKLPVHRYFLSYWYGAGWEQVPEKTFLGLADALLLGQGSSVQILKYLQHKDTALFYEMLAYIGQGNTWEAALHDKYQMSFWGAELRSTWYAYSNTVIAILMILIFAWLGKSGILVKAFRFLRRKS